MIKSFMKHLNFNGVYKPHKLNPGTWVEWFLFLLAAFVSFFIFMYVDITNTIDNSVLFTEAVFSGNFFDFYEYTIEHAHTAYAANYEMLAYIPFALWNLPVAVIDMVSGFDYMHSTLVLLWNKAFIVLLALCAVFIFYKILRFVKVEGDKAVLGCYVLMTAVFFFWPTMIIVQIDILSVVLMLLGLYHYLKGNEKLFILFFALAIPVKSFALFLFIPLLLLKEKRIIFIILKTVLVCCAQLFGMLIYRNSAAYSFAIGSQSRDGMDSLLNYATTIGHMQISLFIVAFVAICIFCYLYKLKEREEKKQFAVSLYVTSFVFTALMIFAEVRSYWTVYVIPFMLLSIFVTDRFFKVNLLLETVSGVSYFMWFANSGSKPTAENNVAWRLLLYKIIERPSSGELKYTDLNGMFKYYSLDEYKYLFFTLFVCCAAAILVLTCPFLFKKYRDVGGNLIERSVILLRPAVLIVIVFLYLFSYTKTTNKAIYNYIDTKTNVSCDSDLLDGYTISQEISFDSDYKLDTLTLVFDNSSSSRRNFSSINVVIKNIASGEDIFSETIGCSMIESKENCRIELGGLYVSSGEEYEIELTGNKGIDYEAAGKIDYSISPYVTEKLTDEQRPVKINGAEQNYNLAFKLK